MTEAAELLRTTLQEEKDTDAKLSELALSKIKIEADEAEAAKPSGRRKEAAESVYLNLSKEAGRTTGLLFCRQNEALRSRYRYANPQSNGSSRKVAALRRCLPATV